MTKTEQLLSVIPVYQASPSLQTTTPGPTARAAGIVTLVRGAVYVEGDTEKESRGQGQWAGCGVRELQLLQGSWEVEPMLKLCALGKACGERSRVSWEICRIQGMTKKASIDRTQTTED